MTIISFHQVIYYEGVVGGARTELPVHETSFGVRSAWICHCNLRAWVFSGSPSQSPSSCRSSLGVFVASSAASQVFLPSLYAQTIITQKTYFNIKISQPSQVTLPSHALRMILLHRKRYTPFELSLCPSHIDEKCGVRGWFEELFEEFKPVIKVSQRVPHGLRRIHGS